MRWIVSLALAALLAACVPAPGGGAAAVGSAAPVASSEPASAAPASTAGLVRLLDEDAVAPALYLTSASGGAWGESGGTDGTLTVGWIVADNLVEFPSDTSARPFDVRLGEQDGVRATWGEDLFFRGGDGVVVVEDGEGREIPWLEAYGACPSTCPLVNVVHLHVGEIAARRGDR